GDLDGQLTRFHPLSPALQRELAAALRRLGANGFDPWVGRKLYGWCYQAGLRELCVHVLPYQLVAGGVAAGELAAWRTTLEQGTQRLVAHASERTRWEQFRAALLAELQRPDLFYYSTLILVRGTVPAPQAGPGR